MGDIIESHRTALHLSVLSCLSAGTQNVVRERGHSAERQFAVAHESVRVVLGSPDSLICHKTDENKQKIIPVLRTKYFHKKPEFQSQTIAWPGCGIGSG